MPFSEDQIPERPAFTGRLIPGYRLIAAPWAFTGERLGALFRDGYAQVDPEELHPGYGDGVPGVNDTPRPARTVVAALTQDLGYADVTDAVFPPAVPELTPEETQAVLAPSGRR